MHGPGAVVQYSQGHSEPTSRRTVPNWTWIVLPAFNEEQDLPALLERIDEAMAEIGLRFEILLVDDGSTDATREIAEQWSNKLPLQVKVHPTNLGLGATLKDGLEWACSVAQPSDVIITLDSDNSHTPELILRMTRLIREGYDVVIASRYQNGSRVRGVPINRRLLSWIARILFKLVFPIKGVKDYTSGYRAYRAGVLQEVTSADPNFFDQDGFQVMVDVLLKLRRNKDLLFGEAPLIIRYDLKEGDSKMDVMGTTTGKLRLVVLRGEVVLEDIGWGGPVERFVGSVVIVEVDKPGVGVVALGF